MLRQDLTWPISIIITMVSVIAFLMLAPADTPSAASLYQTCGIGGTYPTCAPNSSQATATTGGNTNTPVASSTVGTPTVTSTGASTTSTSTATGATATGVTATVSTATATIQATATRPVLTLPPANAMNDPIACLPGSTVFMEGNAPSYTAILVYFAGKAVGGGTTNAAGDFKIPIKIGSEKYGVYEVQARIRSSQRVVAKETCIVPYFSPTSTPSRRSPP